MQQDAPLQHRIWNAKRSGMTYRQIQESFNLSPRDVTKALKRTATGRFWQKSMSGGSDSYLCPEDEKELAEQLRGEAEDRECLRTFEVVELAHCLKAARHQVAIQALRQIGCPELAGQIQIDPKAPSRSWLNDFCQRHGLSIRSSVEIERDRHTAGFSGDIWSFYSRHAARITGTDPRLIFNADETMMSSKRVYKAVADRENMHAITNGLPPYQHMSAMVTINASGESVPPMIILSNLQELPQDLREFQHAAWWASSPNGWMTKRLFTCWAVNFAHWLAKYRAKINVHESMPALLFVDGHSSRINYTALEYLRRANCVVIILPAHTSHITQAFDVSIASPLKAIYKQLLHNFTREHKRAGAYFSAALVRRIAVQAFLDALRTATTITAQRCAFEAVGVCPFNPNRPLSSPFVQPGNSPPFAGSRFTINGIEATDEAALDHIRVYLMEHSRGRECGILGNIWAFQTWCMSGAQSEGRLLSSFESRLRASPGGGVLLEQLDFLC